MTSLDLAATITAAFVTFPAAGLADDSAKKLAPKTAEANLRKAQEAVKHTDGALKLLSKPLYVGSILTNNPDFKEVSRFVEDVRKPVSELKKFTDKVVELAEKQKDKSAAEKESKTLLDMVKLVRIKNQADELDRLSKKVRELPVGLITEKVDNQFLVSPELLVNDPKVAEARFKAYLTAMKTNVEYLKSKQEQLEEVGKLANGAGKFLTKTQSDIEKVVPFSGLYGKALTEFYLNLDQLAKAYNELASQCAAKAKETKHAAEIEQSRHDKLRDSVRTLFGFPL